MRNLIGLLKRQLPHMQRVDREIRVVILTERRRVALRRA